MRLAAAVTIRQVTGYGIQVQDGHGLVDFGTVQEWGGAARQRGVTPDSGEAAQVVDRSLAGTAASQPAPRRAAHAAGGRHRPRIERYWQLTAIINGWPPFPSPMPAFEWLIAALRAHE